MRPVIGKSAKALSCAALLGAALGLSACNTIEGAGRDVSAVGHDVTGATSRGQSAVHSSTGAANN